MTWPDYFPDDCPPADAEPASGEVLRVTIEETPSGADFVPHLVAHPEWKKVKENPCKAAGLSVHREVEDVRRLKRRVPGFKKYKGIARAELDPALGKMLATPINGDSHHTWWVPKAVEAVEYFSPITSEGADE